MIIQQRMLENPRIFRKQDWRTKGTKEVINGRITVYEEYEKVVSYYRWNDEDAEDVCKIFVTKSTRWKIFSNSFS